MFVCSISFVVFVCSCVCFRNAEKRLQKRESLANLVSTNLAGFADLYQIVTLLHCYMQCKCYGTNFQYLRAKVSALRQVHHLINRSVTFIKQKLAEMNPPTQ